MANLHNTDLIFTENNFKIIQNDKYVRFYNCDKLQYADFVAQQRFYRNKIISCICCEDEFIKNNNGDYFTIYSSLHKESYVEIYNFLRNEISNYPNSEFIQIILTLPIWHDYS